MYLVMGIFSYDDMAKKFFGWKKFYKDNNISWSDAKIRSYLFKHYHPSFGLTFNIEGFKEFKRNLDEAISNVQAPLGD